MTIRRNGAHAPDIPTHRLVASTNSGRLALDHANGHDLTCGEGITILLGGQWIEGRVEHDRRLYPQSQSFEQATRQTPTQFADGYYFIAEGGGICGLCVGARVRLRRGE